MQRDNLYSGLEARGGLIAGIRKSAQAVGITMGSAGKNSILEDMRMPGYRLTNDGISILESIKFADPLEEMGRRILLEAVSRSNKASGDGSSTTCVLTAAIIEEGLKHLDKTSAMDIKRSLEACIPLIEQSISKQKRDITVDEVGQVASISAEDEEIGARIQEIYQKIGKEGIIHWDISKITEDSYTIGNGITVDGATYASPYMCDATENGQSTNQIRISNPSILVTTQKIVSASEFNFIAQAVNSNDKKDLIVFCEDYDPLVLNDLVLTRAKIGFRVILIKMPVLWKDEWYQDLQLATGARATSPDYPLKSIKIEDLGTTENILITKEATYIDGVKDLSAHIKALEEENSDQSKLRASRLNTKTARYFVGGISDSAISHRRYKVEDAIAAAYHALHGGVVAGGGLALLNVSSEMPNSVEGKILKIALQTPIKQIIKNRGRETREAQGTYTLLVYFPEQANQMINCDLLGGVYGYDAKKDLGSIDMFKAGIIDSAIITLNAVKNAISVAANILTAETLVLLPREETQSGIPAQII